MDEMTAADHLNLNIMARKLGFRRVLNEDTGEVCYFPETAKSESEWEESAIKMQAEQKIISLAPLPPGKGFRKFQSRTLPGIDPRELDNTAEVKNYADHVKETRVQTKEQELGDTVPRLVRGD